MSGFAAHPYSHLGVTATIVRHALLLGQFRQLAHASLFLSTTTSFSYDEPTLRRQFGKAIRRGPFHRFRLLATSTPPARVATKLPPHQRTALLHDAATRSGDVRWPGPRFTTPAMTAAQASDGATCAPCSARKGSVCTEGLSRLPWTSSESGNRLGSECSFRVKAGRRMSLREASPPSRACPSAAACQLAFAKGDRRSAISSRARSGARLEQKLSRAAPCGGGGVRKTCHRARWHTPTQRSSCIEIL